MGVSLRRASRLPSLAMGLLLLGRPAVGPGPLLAQGRALPGRAGAAPATDTAAAPDSITLEEALREARTSNARLPVARMAMQQALDRVRQDRGALWPRLSLEGDLHPGTPRQYESSDARARLVASAPLYEGGELRAAVRADRARSEASRADYRVAQKDVELAVRADFAQDERARTEVELQRRGLDRLERYLSEVRARQAAGQGVGADVVRTQARLAQQRADLAAARQALEQIRMELADLLGRDPRAPLVPASEPPPSAPSPPPAGAPWSRTPDVRGALASVSAAEADLAGAHSLRRPHLELSLSGGGQAALVDPAPALMNDGRGWGFEALFSLSFPLWDNGIYRGRLSKARDALSQSRFEREAIARDARLAFDRAASLSEERYREIRTREEALQSARDAYLQAESLYRGGAGSALEVLDAFRALVAAGQARAEALLDYRLAEARRLRWGTE